MGNAGSKRLHLVKWKTICSPKKIGGLGLTSLEVQNLASMGKWISKWHTDRHRSWNKWIRSKYECTKSGGIPYSHTTSCHSDFTKDLVDLQNNSAIGPNLSFNNFSWLVKNGNSVLFWEDIWLDGILLKDTFKRLYRISNLKEVEVRVFYDLWDCYDHKSNVFWKRSLRSSDEDDLLSMENIIKGISLSSPPDKFIWSLSKDPYSVKEGTKRFYDFSISEHMNWNFIWSIKVPAKITIFLWKLHSKVLPTKSFLSDRLGSFLGSSLCSLCKSHNETLNHLFWECNLSKSCWRSVLDWWGLSNKNVFSNVTEMWGSSRWFKEGTMKKLWHLILVATVWTIWLKRNEVIFKNQQINPVQIIILVKFRVKEWALALDLLNKDTMIWWELNPMGSVTRSVFLRKQGLLLSGFDLVGFIDGSWSTKNGVMKAGIGGILKDSVGRVKMNFSGPVLATNPFFSELGALNSFLMIVKEHITNMDNMVIYTDSASLVDLVLNFKATKLTYISQDFGLDECLKEAHFVVKKISRHDNLEADQLAKNGASFIDLSYTWF